MNADECKKCVRLVLRTQKNTEIQSNGETLRKYTHLAAVPAHLCLLTKTTSPCSEGGPLVGCQNFCRCCHSLMSSVANIWLQPSPRITSSVSDMGLIVFRTKPNRTSSIEGRRSAQCQMNRRDCASCLSYPRTGLIEMVTVNVSWTTV